MLEHNVQAEVAQDQAEAGRSSTGLSVPEVPLRLREILPAVDSCRSPAHFEYPDVVLIQ